MIKLFELAVNWPKHQELMEVMAKLDQEKRLEVLKIATFLLYSKDSNNLTDKDKEAMKSYKALTKILKNQID